MDWILDRAIQDRSRSSGTRLFRPLRLAQRIAVLWYCIAILGCSQNVESHIDLQRNQVASVIPGASMLPSSLALTRTGKPAIASVTSAPEYAIQYVEIGKPPEIVGSAGNAEHLEVALSLAFTPEDRPMIAYTDDRSGDLVLAERTPQGWINETVDTAGQVGYFLSLAVDGSGQPHISYFDNTLNDTKYAYRETDGWRIETIDAEGQPGFHIPAGFTQLVLRCEPSPSECTTERPQVAYLAYRYKPYDGELRFATRYDWGWYIETVDSATGAGGFPSLALDAEDKPWISYYRAGTWDYHSGELRVAHRENGKWQVEAIDRSDNSGRFSDLALSPARTPFVAYYAATHGDLRLAWRNGSHWQTQMLATEGDVGAWVQLAIDKNDLVHMTYVDADERTTKLSVFVAPH